MSKGRRNGRRPAGPNSTKQPPQNQTQAVLTVITTDGPLNFQGHYRRAQPTMPGMNPAAIEAVKDFNKWPVPEEAAIYEEWKTKCQMLEQLLVLALQMGTQIIPGKTTVELNDKMWKVKEAHIQGLPQFQTIKVIYTLDHYQF